MDKASKTDLEEMQGFAVQQFKTAKTAFEKNKGNAFIYEPNEVNEALKIALQASQTAAQLELALKA